MTNFNRPYFAKSVSEFWKRWHISLSTWFKDYLYISLGGNKVSIPRWYFNLFIVFVVSGFWHGANWTFIIWGALNGMYLIVAIKNQGISKKIFESLKFKSNSLLLRVIQTSVTFILICIAWVFFRSENATVAVDIISKIFRFNGDIYLGAMPQFICSIIAIVMLIIIELKAEIRKEMLLKYIPYWLKEQVTYLALILSILLIGVFDGGQFIYFQF